MFRIHYPYLTHSVSSDHLPHGVEGAVRGEFRFKELVISWPEGQQSVPVQFRGETRFFQPGDPGGFWEKYLNFLLNV